MNDKVKGFLNASDAKSSHMSFKDIDQEKIDFLELHNPANSPSLMPSSGQLFNGFIRKAAIASLALIALLSLRKTIDTHSESNDLKRTRALMSRDWAGLNPDYYLSKMDIVPSSDRSQIQADHRDFEDDFRRISFAKYARPPNEADEYKGYTCLTHYPGHTCPWPSQCTPPAQDNPLAVKTIAEKGACVHWKQGKLAHPIKANANDVQRGRDTSYYTPDWDTEGEWKDNSWIPKSKRKYRFFTPQDMHSCLLGKRILVQGDSM